MTGAGIFLIHEAGGMVEMLAEPYASEDLLQTILERYPAVMPGAAIDPARPRRWLLLGREVGVPATAEGGSQWSVDHLFADQDAIPTVVEVKRSTDTRIRREVVGQMLDYAANGVRYWPIERLRARFESAAEAASQDPNALIAALTADETSDPETFWRQLEANLRAGRIRMLFVADRIPAELQRIIEFLNEQMRPAEVLGVELQQYRAEGVRTLVPRVVGATATAREAKGVRDVRSFDDRLAEAGADVHEVVQRLERWAGDRGFTITTTRVARQVRDPDGRRTLVQVYLPEGYLEFGIGNLPDASRDALGAVLDDFAGRTLTRKSPYFAGVPVLERWDEFVRLALDPYAAAKLESVVDS